VSEWQETEVGRIPSDWSLMTIDEIKDNKRNAIAMGPFGSNIKSDNFVPNGVPVIRGNNLVDYIFNEEEFVYLKEKKADSLKASLCYSGDLIFTHRGTIGQVGLIPNNSKFKRYIVSQSGMKLSCNDDIVDNEYVFLFFKTKIGQHLLLRSSSQTGVPSIAQPSTSLKGMPFVVDDILIGFDDNRTRVCLEVLAELSTSIQVLLFTHHRRVLELANSCNGESKIFQHSLS